MDKILSWDPLHETWDEAGQLLVRKSSHAAVEVSIGEFAEYCVHSSSPTVPSTSTTSLSSSSTNQALVCLCYLGIALNIAVHVM